MSKNAANSLRGAIGFGAGIIFATSLAFLGFPIEGVILGGAIAGALLASKARDFRLILLARRCNGCQLWSQERCAPPL